LETILPDLPSSSRTHVGLEQRVLARLKRVGLHPGAGVTVGFSGGADSLALAAVLARLAPVVAVRVSLVHVDHGLRLESAGDADACERLAEALRLPFVAVRLPVGLVERHAGVGVEEAARRERYVALAREAEVNGSAILAVAHHRDDQAETVLLHLLRGAGLSGASGMAELSRMTVPWWEAPRDGESRTIQLWRPFLDEPRATVRDYAIGTGLAPSEDATNDEGRFRRNRLRHEVMPLLQSISPGADAALARYARIARAEDGVLEAMSDQALARAARVDSTLSMRALSEEHPAIRRRVVLAWLRGFGVPDEVALERIDGVLDAVERRRGGCRIEIGGGWSVLVGRGALSVRAPAEDNDDGDGTTGTGEEGA
jgi:tRNA(Ile)-lysidine synthetase-like protein